MKKTYLYLSIWILAGIFSSCSDFLDEEAKGIQVDKNYYKTESDAVAATDAIYSYLISDADAYNLWSDNFGGLFYNDYWELPELMVRQCDFQTNQSPEFNQSIANFQVDAYSIRVASLWRDFYTTINVCNTVIAKVLPIHFTDEIKKIN